MIPGRRDVDGGHDFVGRHGRRIGAGNKILKGQRAGFRWVLQRDAPL